MEISVATYVKILKNIKSYIRNYKKIVRNDWTGYDMYPYYKYGRNFMAFCSMLYKNEIEVFKDHNQPRGMMVLHPMHRMIIGNKLGLVINLSTGGIIICHEFGSHTNPLMPLNEYIHYLERGLADGTIKPGDKVSLLPKENNTGAEVSYSTCAARVFTVCTSNLEYPIIYKAYYFDKSVYDKPMCIDIVFDFMVKGIAEFIDQNCPERRRKYHDRKTDKPHKPATE